MLNNRLLSNNTPPSISKALGIGASLVALTCAVVVAALVGAIALPPVGVMHSLIAQLPFVSAHDSLTPTQHAVLWQLRMPRVVLAGIVGAMLSLCGASYQGVFRNPLVDPYLLGAAAGAGLGATLVIAYGSSEASQTSALLPAAAFVGAIVGVGFSYALGSLADRTNTTATLVLAGVAVTSFFTAVQTFVQQQNSDSLRAVYSWILGRIGTNGWHDVLIVLPYATVSAVILLVHRRSLDILSLGDDKAKSMGVSPRRVRLLVVIAASLGTASVVAVSGLIGFVGIIVPHIVRRLVGTSYRIVLPVALLGGATFVILADLVARTAVRPAELPIGVVTAFIGAPFFGALLLARRNAT